MLARIQKSMKENDEGFTLIELLVVIIIIGILAAIAVPTFLNQRKKGWDAQAKADLKNMATAQETWLTDKGTYATAATGLADLTSVGFNKSADTTPSVVSGSDTAYCLKAISKSTTPWFYSSVSSVPSTTACT
jgi:type IV pilus assembly protein PilA